jgi:flavin-dependent dehydrogenase
VKKNITIYGAGLSGLTAAINLARKGHDVTLHEKEKRIGGPTSCTPAIHMTPVQFQKMKQYIGIDVEPCFSELEFFKAHVYSKSVTFDPHNLFVTERGPNKTSLDSFLYSIALEEGVQFEFSSPFIPKILDSLPNYSIIATGAYSTLWKYLKLPCIPFLHYDAQKKIQKKQNFCHAYFNNYLVTYAYLAAKGGLVSISVPFLLHNPYKKNILKFQKRLKEDNFEFDNWALVWDNFPEKIHLFKKVHDKIVILAGAISGFIDPFFGFGVNSSLISGKIAATSVISKKKGMAEFKRFSKHLNGMFLLSRIYDFIPFKDIIIPRFFYCNKGFPIIKENMKSIPGFTHEGCFKIIDIKN